VSGDSIGKRNEGGFLAGGHAGAELLRSKTRTPIEGCCCFCVIE